MQANIGKTDKMIRIFLGGAIVGASIYYEAWWGLAVALVPIATALINFCPLYAPFKISTLKESSGANR